MVQGLRHLCLIVVRIDRNYKQSVDLFNWLTNYSRNYVPVKADLITWINGFCRLSEIISSTLFSPTAPSAGLFSFVNEALE